MALLIVVNLVKQCCDHTDGRSIKGCLRGSSSAFVSFPLADDKYRRAFMKGGGIAQLVRFLDV